MTLHGIGLTDKGRTLRQAGGVAASPTAFWERSARRAPAARSGPPCFAASQTGWGKVARGCQRERKRCRVRGAGCRVEAQGAGVFRRGGHLMQTKSSCVDGTHPRRRHRDASRCWAQRGGLLRCHGLRVDARGACGVCGAERHGGGRGEK